MIHLAQVKDAWLAVVKAVMNTRFPWNAVNFLNNWGQSSLWRMALLHGRSYLEYRHDTDLVLTFCWPCISV